VALPVVDLKQGAELSECPLVARQADGLSAAGVGGMLRKQIAGLGMGESGAYRLLLLFDHRDHLGVDEDCVRRSINLALRVSESRDLLAVRGCYSTTGGW
jgi:hypothetical protein